MYGALGGLDFSVAALELSDNVASPSHAFAFSSSAATKLPKSPQPSPEVTPEDPGEPGLVDPFLGDADHGVVELDIVIFVYVNAVGF